MTYRKGNWLQTYSGVKFYPYDPRPEDILIEDIAHALSMICRFNGHSELFYSVAQHSVMCSYIVSEKNRLWALLHDAAETYVGDLIRPIKSGNTALGMTFRGVENKIMGIICDKFGLSREMPYEVRQADTRMLATELRDIICKEADSWGLEKVTPLNEYILPMSAPYAKKIFLSRFRELTD
jgi:5'-deoxynucleotidase YfbR-like HD superfamily hydrolase